MRIAIPIWLLFVGCLWLSNCGGVIHGEAPDGGQDGADAGGDGGWDGGGDPGGADGDGEQPGVDSDGDGLPDDWERAAGDLNRLDPARADSDGDGTGDGREDYDGDGLTNLQEYAASRFSFYGDISAPHPLRRDLLVELDQMTGCAPTAAQLAGVAEAFAALALTNPDGTTGVGLHFVRDETALAKIDFDGSFEQRWAYFAAHGPTIDDGGQPPLPLDEMIHVVFAARRSDLPDRGGETVLAGDGQLAQAGVFMYIDVINDTFPTCDRPDVGAITPQEAVVGTLVHELGHTLQLGHDTEVGGGVNAYNIMAVPASCAEAQMRAHGVDNADPSLGNTEDVAAPRFSQDAAALMDFGSKISVDTATIADTDGYEM